MLRKVPLLGVALRKESVDRNSRLLAMLILVHMSLSARRAWIEMQVFQRIAKPFRVALRKESVDRNFAPGQLGASFSLVALRKESVDRNQLRGGPAAAENVALRKESVDRNGQKFRTYGDVVQSLSARRAWIEMVY